jgi:hypothetical protein
LVASVVVDAIRDVPEQMRVTCKAPGRAWSAVSVLSRSSGYLPALALYTIALCAANFRLIFTHQMPIWDAQQYHHPYYILLADLVRSGRLLFWNPFSAGGVPIFVDPQVAAFSPLTLLAGLVTGGTTGGYIFYWLMLLWLGGAGVILLARDVKAPLWAAVVAAVGYSTSGFNTGHSEHLSWIYAAGLFPHVIYCINRGVAEGRTTIIAAGGVMLGIAGLGGYPGLVIAMCVFSVVWMAGYSVALPSDRRRWNPFQLLGNLMVFSIVSIVVMAPVYYGFFHEAAGITSRTGTLSREFAQTNPLAPGAIASLISPVFVVMKLAHKIWPATDLSSLSLYSGSLTVALALLSPFNRRKRPVVAGTACLALLCLAISMGEATPLRGWVYDYFPPSRYFRHPALFRLFFVFGIAMLSLYGSLVLQEVIEGRIPARPGTWWVRAARLGVLLVCVAAFAGYLFYMSRFPVGPPFFLQANLHFLVSWGGTFLIAALLPWLARPARAALPVLLVGIACADGVMNITVSRPVISQPARRFPVSNHNVDLTKQKLRREPGSDSNFNLLSKMPGFITYCPLNSRNVFYNRIVADKRLFNLVTSGDRVWLCEQPVTIAPSEQNFSMLASRPDFLDAFRCVIHDGEAMAGESGARPGLQPSLEGFTPSVVPLTPSVEQYIPGRFKFSVDSPSAGYLFIADRWARSWRATLNGQQAEVLGGSFIFTSLRIAPGKNTVELVYDPAAVKYLLLVSYALSALIGVLAAAGRPRRECRTGR